MRYTASIYVNDVMDQVVVCARVFGDPGGWGPTELRLESVSQFSGEGQDDPGEWLKDACIQLIELL